MIDRASIMAWAEQAPWTDPAMVEQDLIICRALVDIFTDKFDPERAFQMVRETFIDRLPGRRR